MPKLPTEAYDLIIFSSYHEENLYNALEEGGNDLSDVKDLATLHRHFAPHLRPLYIFDGLAGPEDALRPLPAPTAGRKKKKPTPEISDALRAVFAAVHAEEPTEGASYICFEGTGFTDDHLGWLYDQMGALYYVDQLLGLRSISRHRLVDGRTLLVLCVSAD